jgi:hypothetical protein
MRVERECGAWNRVSIIRFSAAGTAVGNRIIAGLWPPLWQQSALAFSGMM